MFKSLKENRDFKRLYYRGKTEKSSVLVTYVQKSRLDHTRIGVTTSKKIGNAVQRNRARRIIKAAFFELEPLLTRSYDIVLVARTRTVFMKSTDIKKAMTNQFKQLGMIP